MPTVAIAATISSPPARRERSGRSEDARRRPHPLTVVIQATVAEPSTCDSRRRAVIERKQKMARVEQRTREHLEDTQTVFIQQPAPMLAAESHQLVK